MVIIIIQAIDAYQDYHVHEYLRNQNHQIVQMIDSQICLMEKLLEDVEGKEKVVQERK